MNTSLIVPNFRDVGTTINSISGEDRINEGVLFRGGNIRLVKDLSLIHNPKTIINLRIGKDPEFKDVKNYQLPEPNNSEVYDARNKSIRKWIGSAINIVASPDTETPIYIHCAAGKDRTGVIVAAILSAIGIPRSFIFQDYELSVGGLKPKLFSKTLDTMQNEKFFKAVDVQALKKMLLS